MDAICTSIFTQVAFGRASAPEPRQNLAFR